MSFRSRASALFAARPRPEKPESVELDQDQGDYGGRRDETYTSRLEASLRPLLAAGRKLTARNIAEMRRHYQVRACETVLAMPVMRADWTIECDDEDIREWLTSAYDRIAADVQRSATKAITFGYSPNVLRWTADPELGGLIVDKIRDLDPATCEPLVTKSGGYGGFVQNRRGGAQSDRLEVAPLASLWLVEGMESGNLYGRSVLEAALDPWLDHTAVRLFHARYLERFGEPVVKSRAPGGSTVANQREIDDAVAAGEAPPDPIIVDNLTRARQVGEQLRHHSVVALPSDHSILADGKTAGYAWDLDYLESTGGGGQDFREALEDYDRAIARALFVPDLLFANTEGGAYALGREHRSVFDASVEGRLDDNARQITRHLIDRYRVWNFGEKAPAARLVFGGVTDTDRSELWELAKILLEGGRLPLEIEEVAARLGLPLSEEEIPPVVPGAPVDEDEQIAAGRERERIELLAASPVDGLPDWKLPQSYDPPPWRRELTSRERRSSFAKMEDGLNRAEVATIAEIEEALEQSRERVLRQLRGILKLPTLAEQLAGIGTLELGSSTREAKSWDALLRTVWTLGLEAVAVELPAYAEQIPSGLGPEGRALASTYATASAERHFADLSTRIRLELANGLTSGVTRAGLDGIVADLFEREVTSEARPMRLTTRMLASKGLNQGRRDAIERGGVPLRGAQYSALLDRRTCDLCLELDELVIAIEHTDLSRFTPPVHHNCRCVWVWITREEADFEPTWSTPSPTKVDRYGGLVL